MRILLPRRHLLLLLVIVAMVVVVVEVVVIGVVVVTVCISLQYLLKNAWDEADFCPEDKHESFLPVDGITLGVGSQTCRK